MSEVIKSTEFNPSNISYSEPKQLSGGRGKTVYVHYNESSQYSIQTPVMPLPFGLSIDDRQEVPKYAIDLSFRGMEGNSQLQKCKDRLVELDENLVDDGVENSMAWFKKKKTSKEVVSRLYNAVVRVSKDKETGEPDGRFPPTMKAKIPNYEGRWGCDIFDDKKNELKPTPEELKDLISKGTKVQALIRCTGVYFAAGKFGVTWRVTQLKIFKSNSLKGYAFIDDSDDEVEENDEHVEVKPNIEKQLDNQVEDSDDDDVSDDSEDEDEVKPVVKKIKKKS